MAISPVGKEVTVPEHPWSCLELFLSAAVSSCLPMTVQGCLCVSVLVCIGRWKGGAGLPREESHP